MRPHEPCLRMMALPRHRAWAVSQWRASEVNRLSRKSRDERLLGHSGDPVPGARCFGQFRK